MLHRSQLTFQRRRLSLVRYLKKTHVTNKDEKTAINNDAFFNSNLWQHSRASSKRLIQKPRWSVISMTNNSKHHRECFKVVIQDSDRSCRVVVSIILTLLKMMFVTVKISNDQEQVQSEPISCRRNLNVCLILKLFHVHGKKLRSRWDGHLLNHTVPGQPSRWQFTSIKRPFFRQ